MNVLSLNAYNGDSAECLLVGGKLVAPAEAERFRRIKRWAGLPTQGDRLCLPGPGLTINEVNHDRRRSQLVIAGKCNPSYESKLQMDAARHSYMVRVGALHRRQNRRAMFFSIYVSEPDYAYILRRF